jgi:hypothetical protein
MTLVTFRRVQLDTTPAHTEATVTSYTPIDVKISEDSRSCEYAWLGLSSLTVCSSSKIFDDFDAQEQRKIFRQLVRHNRNMRF